MLPCGDHGWGCGGGRGGSFLVRLVGYAHSRSTVLPLTETVARGSGVGAGAGAGEAMSG